MVWLINLLISRGSRSLSVLLLFWLCNIHILFLSLKMVFNFSEFYTPRIQKWRIFRSTFVLILVREHLAEFMAFIFKTLCLYKVNDEGYGIELFSNIQCPNEEQFRTSLYHYPVSKFLNTCLQKNSVSIIIKIQEEPWSL